MTEHHLCRVPPFGNLGVKNRLHLVRAYRSWPRPSSLSGAKASTLHPLLPHLKMLGVSFGKVPTKNHYRLIFLMRVSFGNTCIYKAKPDLL